MDRRQMLGAGASLLALAGLEDAELLAVDSEPDPLFLKVKVPRRLSGEEAAFIADMLNDKFKDSKGRPIPVLVLPEGGDIEAVTDPRSQ